MKYDRIIRESLDQNLSGLHVSRQQQMDMIEEIVGGKKMKKKIPLSLALAAILMLVSVTALAVGTNLFDYFANRDARYGKLAELAANVTAAPVEMDSEALGAVNARIDSVYYDGQSLSVGFIIENSTRIEAYTPAAEELANAEIVVDPVKPVPRSAEEQCILGEFEAAVESGVPYGYALYRVYPSDHTYVNDVDVPPYTSTEEYDEIGTYRAIRDFESPLPDGVRDLDSVDLSIQLYETMSVHYFDGENIYHYGMDKRDAGTIDGSAQRVEAESRVYAGSVEIEGVAFTAEATLSAMQGRISISSDGDVFRMVDREFGGHTWQELPWQVRIFDENGAEYEANDGVSLVQERTVEAPIMGSGELPEELHIYLLYADAPDESYNYWPDEEKGLENPHLVLKAAE